MLPRQSTCIVQLGKFGDLLQLFPAFRLMFEHNKIEPTVMVSKEYANIFDGISYANPWVVGLDWWRGTAKARQMAEERFERTIVPQYWNDKDGVPESEAAATKLRFTAHGRTWSVEGEAADYGTCMWNRLGFTRAQMLSEPLVIDRRDSLREEALFAQHVHNRTKPLLLYNFTGVCSPFGFVPEMMRLLRDFRSRFEMVDLGAIKAQRIYDLLGLYDRAVGVISSDTSTFHLCNGSKVPSILFSVDSTGESIPRGNVAFHSKYSQVPKNLGNIADILNQWATT